MKTLYLRIYVTIVLVLVVFGLPTVWLTHQRVTHETQVVARSERMAAWGELLGHVLPAASAPLEAQRAALVDWSDRLHLPLALDSASGQRIATSPLWERLEQGRHEMSGRRPEEPRMRGASLSLQDGRTLWVLRPPWGRWREALPPRAENRNGSPPPRPGVPGMDATLWMPPGPAALAPWFVSGRGMAVALLILALAVAVGAYPVVRRLTRRLEQLRMGVEAFGSGDLSLRVDVRGHDEVASVARSFNRAAQRIEALVRSHRSLLANASHELRSPLARLKMAVALWPGADPQRLLTLQAEIDRDIQELDALVEEVLLASRLDTQAPVAHDPIELLGLVVEEAARSQAVAEGQVVHLHGDERLLRRAVRNLLDNAQRYGRGEQGEVTAHVSVQAHAVDGPPWALIRVEDHGPGIPEDQRERIFEAFYRLPGHAELSGGVGLGLSLVRQIVQRHAGRVRCEARQDGAPGSAFIIELPLGPSDPVAGGGAGKASVSDVLTR